MTRKLLPVVAALTLALVVAPAARSSDPLAGGTTKLKPGKAVSVVLVSHGITLEQSSFSISGGSISSGHALGSIAHSGTLTFRGQNGSLAATGLVVNLGNRSTLTGLVGGTRMAMLTLDLRNARVVRKGLDTRITGLIANLTRPAARALNRTFSTAIFARGLKLGTISITAKPASVALGSGSTSIALDPALAVTLQGLGVVAGPVGSGESLAVPVAGGRLNTAGTLGAIGHASDAGLQFRRDTTSLVLTDFVIRLSKKPRLTAKHGTDRLTVANLDLGAVKPALAGRRFTLTGVGMRLTTSAAKALNQAFGTTAFATGTVLGSATIKATATS